MYGLSFDKISVIIACSEGIYGRYCIKEVTMITFVFNIKSFSFSVVKNKQTRLLFLALIGRIDHLHDGVILLL